MLVTKLQFNPLKGYDFGQKTFYSEHHLGVDLVTNKTPLELPMDLFEVSYTIGKQGGNTVTGLDIEGYLHRFMHLSEFKTKETTIKAGTTFGISGNTGGLSKGDHLHWDIRLPSTPRTLLVFKNFIDPRRNWTLNILPKINDLNTNENDLTDWEQNALAWAKEANVIVDPSYAVSIGFTIKQVAWVAETLRKLTLYIIRLVKK